MFWNDVYCATKVYTILTKQWAKVAIRNAQIIRTRLDFFGVGIVVVAMWMTISIEAEIFAMSTKHHNA